MRAFAPHWGVLLGLTLFLAVGLAVLDDYGIIVDEAFLRQKRKRGERDMERGVPGREVEGAPRHPPARSAAPAISSAAPPNDTRTPSTTPSVIRSRDLLTR